VNRFMTAALIGAVLLSGCREQQGTDQETGSITPADIQQTRAGWPDGLAAAIDSGNARFSDDDFAAALRHYEEATRIAPDVTAGWFGIFMTQTALGDTTAANAAMQRVREIAPGATLVHPDTVPAALPPGHPTTTGQ
jgi:hypothetical protein